MDSTNIGDTRGGEIAYAWRCPYCHTIGEGHAPTEDEAVRDANSAYQDRHLPDCPSRPLGADCAIAWGRAPFNPRDELEAPR